MTQQIEAIYQVLMFTAAGMAEVLDAIAEDNAPELESLGASAQIEDDMDHCLDVADCLQLSETNPRLLDRAQRRLWYWLDERAGRIAHEKAGYAVEA